MRKFVQFIILVSILSGISFAQKKWVFTPPAGGGAPLVTAYSQSFTAGGVITIPWSGDTNPSAGGWETTTSTGCGYTGMCNVAYNFANFNSVISTQLGFGAKKVRVVLAAAQFGGHNSFVPNYIFDAAYAANHGFTQQHTCADTDYVGSGAIAAGSCAQGVDNTAAPVYWITTEPFRPRWIAAAVAAVNNIATCTVGTCGYDKTSIDSVRIGEGLGGEAFPWGTSAMVQLVYGSVSVPNMAQFQTDWIDGTSPVGYVQAMEVAVNAANSGLRFIQSQNGGITGGNANGNTQIPYSWADREAAVAHANGWGHGDQGLTGNWSGATGTVTTNGTAVTWVTGTLFQTVGWAGTITINGTGYQIQSVGSSTTLTLGSSAGVQSTPVAYTFGLATANNADIQRFAAKGYTSGTTNVFAWPSFDAPYVFSIYPNDIILELQTGGGGASDPTGVTSPGSLLLILPYAISKVHPTDIEIYWADWQVAYDSGSTYYATYHVQYQQILSGTFPSGLSGVSGAGSLTGTSIFQ